jgi:hypothetical protein
MARPAYPLLPVEPSQHPSPSRQPRRRGRGSPSGPWGGWNRGGIWGDQQQRRHQRRQRRRADGTPKQQARSRSSLERLPPIASPAPPPPQCATGADELVVRDDVVEMRRRSEQQARAMFQEADLDGDGSLQLEEVVALAARFGHALSERQGRAAMRQMDRDGDGEVDFDEFYTWWTQGNVVGTEPDFDFVQVDPRSPEHGGPMDIFRAQLEGDGDDDDAASDSASEVPDDIHGSRPGSRERLNHSMRSTGAFSSFNDTLLLPAGCLNDSPRSLQRRCAPPSPQLLPAAVQQPPPPHRRRHYPVPAPQLQSLMSSLRTPQFRRLALAAGGRHCHSATSGHGGARLALPHVAAP